MNDIREIHMEKRRKSRRKNKRRDPCGNRQVRRILIWTLIFGGAFLIGMGAGPLVLDRQIRREYESSSLNWKRDLAGGMDSKLVRDSRNEEILKNREQISIATEIVLEHGGAAGEVRIANGANGRFDCVMMIVNDATGETIYESGLIEPGHYVEYGSFHGSLTKGYYPCTAVGSFYTENGEYAGELAWKVAVIIKN